MKKLLIRAGMSPLDSFDAATVINRNSIGRNVGNLVYQYGLYRTLWTEQVEDITPNYYRSLQDKADEINEQYDAFIIPLADAFRADFMPELRNLTKLIRKLTIPCVVIGVGLRAPFETGEKLSYPFDEDIRDFMKAVLEKSAMIGLRGEYTSAYLTNLGFRPEIDHTVIGCPSMYTNGPDMHIRELNLTADSRVSINRNVLNDASVQGFLDRVEEQYPDHYFLPQILTELRLLYTGMPYYHKQKGGKYGHYPTTLSDQIYADDRVKFFLNVPTWRKFLSTVDLSVGTRLHGNITATISGAPSLLIAHDARTRELTEYHHLTHVWAKDITEKTDLAELVAKLDFQEVSRHHKANFDHFVDFLDKNGLDHIYKNGACPQEAPLDRLVREADLQPPVVSALHCSTPELVRRLEEIMPQIDKNSERYKNDNVKLKGQISDSGRAERKMQETIQELQEEKKQLQKDLKKEQQKPLKQIVKEKVKKKLNK